MIKSWWKQWGLIDLLALGVGLLLCVGYIAYQYVCGSGSPLLDLWPNIATEILGVWISVRVIDGLIRKREERHRVRNAVVGNLNFMMSICQDLPPEFFDDHINDLSNELMWFTEKRTAHQKLIEMLFTNEERSGIDAVIQHVSNVRDFSTQVVTTMSRIKDAENTDQGLDSHDDVYQLFKVHRRFIRSGGTNQEALSEQMAAVTRGLEENRYPQDQRQEIERIQGIMGAAIDEIDQVRMAIHGVEVSLKQLRRTIGEGM